MDDAGPPSLFVVAYYGVMDPPYFSILQLDTPELPLEKPELQLDTLELKLEKPEQIKKTKVDEKEYVRFNQEPQDHPSIRWLFSPPTSSTEDLYMVPHWEFSRFRPLHGYKFNFTTGRFLPITPPSMPSKPSKLHGHVVNLRGHIYYMAHDRYHSVFQCYDPDENSWKSLDSLPHDYDLAWLGPIVATAVWGDTILFNLNYTHIWAYDVIENKWYLVHVEDKQCYHIVGEAVVLGDNIYALTDESFDLVIALSIQKNRIGGDLVFKCSLGSLNFVRGIKPINHQDQEAWGQKTCGRTRHLVHLGKDNFCLVQSCNLWFGFDGYQDIQLTYIKLKGENSRIVENFIHKVKLQPPGEEFEQFEVLLCFSLPKCKTTALKEGKSFSMDPYPEDYVSILVQEEEDEDEKLDNDSSQTNIPEEEAIDSKDEKKQALDQPKSEGTAVLEEDRVSLFESELEELKIQKSVESAILDSAVNEKKELKLELEVVAESEAAQIKQVEVAKSEPIVTDGIIVKRKKKGKRFPYLESQSATSKQLAIKASPIRIWDCRTEIFAAAFTLVDCNRTQAVDSSSFGKNKFKDHGEVSRSKTTCAGGPKGKKKRPYKVAPQGLQKKVKEQLDFSEEERNKALQDAEESNKQPLEKSSKLEETHKALKLEEEAIDDEKKQALDQPKSEGTAVLEEDHVSLFGSELEELKIQKSVESAIILDCAVNEIKELKLELEIVAESEAAQKKQAEVAKSELKEAERAVRVMEAELKTLNGQLEQWRKFAVMHSTGNNGNFLNRSLSMGSKYSPGDDDLIGKKNRNVLKKLGISWKKPLQNTGMIKSS